MRYEALINLVIGGVKNEKFKGLLNDGIKGEHKLRFITLARKRSSLLKLWTLRAAFVMLLWTIIVVQFKGLGDMVTPAMFKTSTHSSAFSLPPQSTYLNLSGNFFFFLMMIFQAIKKTITGLLLKMSSFNNYIGLIFFIYYICLDPFKIFLF